METVHKVIITLLVLAIVFSVVSTLFNLSLINFDFKPINVKVPSQVQGSPRGDVQLYVEGNAPAASG
jgi:hypothetical protein